MNAKRFSLRQQLACYFAAVLAGCGGGGGGGGGQNNGAGQALGAAPASSSKSSYGIAREFAGVSNVNWNQFHVSNEFISARALADFDGDGFLDVFVSPGPFQVLFGTPMHAFKGTQENTANWISGSVPELVHPRKMIVGDYNGDSVRDVFVCATGYDAAPFPGTTNALLLSNGSGKWIAASQAWSGYVGFHHGCTSDDIDKDGDIDIFVTDSKTSSYFLVNDGLGNFTQDKTRLPASLNRTTPVFTAEMFDLDNDGDTDLVVGGAEPAQATQVFWGNGTGAFSDAAATTVAAVSGWQNPLVLAAEDIDGDGVKELVIGRTKGNLGDADFYQGYLVQVLKVSARAVTDVTSAWASSLNASAPTILSSNGIPTWVEWLWLADRDGDGRLDVIVSDEWIGGFWAKNNGGSFGSWQKL